MNEKKILVVDDEWAIRYLLEGQLRRAGYTVYAVADGRDALSIIESFAPDLVILDIMMPEIDGFEVCRRMRRHPQMADTPIIFLSGSITKEYKHLAFQLGANDFLVKPFQTEMLLARIEAVFRRRSQTNGQFAGRAASSEIASTMGQIVGLIGSAPGVGTTTLAIQLSETIALHSHWPVLLIDLDLSAGQIATQLKLFHTPHILDLLAAAEAESDPLLLVGQHAQRHQAGLHVIPAPVQAETTTPPCLSQLTGFLESIIKAGYYVVLDLGAAVDEWTLEVLQQANLVYAVALGQSPEGSEWSEFANQLVQLGVQSGRVIPVAGESAAHVRRENGSSGGKHWPPPGAKAQLWFGSADNRLRHPALAI